MGVRYPSALISKLSAIDTLRLCAIVSDYNLASLHHLARNYLMEVPVTIV